MKSSNNWIFIELKEFMHLSSARAPTASFAFRFRELVLGVAGGEGNAVI